MKTMTKPMRRMINTAIVYFALAMCAGIFYREFTKAFAYTGPTPLKAVHAHLLMLGMLLFLVLALFCQNNPQLTDCNSFACFYVIYNISLPIMALLSAHAWRARRGTRHTEPHCRRDDLRNCGTVTYRTRRRTDFAVRGDQTTHAGGILQSARLHRSPQLRSFGLHRGARRHFTKTATVSTWWVCG